MLNNVLRRARAEQHMTAAYRLCVYIERCGGVQKRAWRHVVTMTEGVENSSPVGELTTAR
jgi:hypothetical protein